MNIRVIRRGLLILLADIFIIIGIFFLQFRTDSNKIEKLGSLQITLTETQNDENITILSNKLQVSYNGIVFSCDDQNPVKVLYKKTGDVKAVVLKSWEKDSDFSYQFTFEDDIKIRFILSDLTSEAKFSVITIVPSTISELYLPYNYSYTMNILSEEKDQVIFADKKNSWMLQAYDLENGYVTFGDDDFTASYVVYNEVEKFSFNTMVASIGDRSPDYTSVLDNFKNTFIASFKATTEANYTEQAVVAYVAAMGERGQYKTAVDEIPQSFKKSDKRTYLSAPYFNTLESMNVTLDRSIKNVSTMITKSAETGSLDIFAGRNIANYMCIHPKQSEVYRIINSALTADFDLVTLPQATGIMEVFNDFCVINPEYANRLRPIMDLCVKRIENSCTFDGEKVLISENDTFVSVVQGVEIGSALMRYSINTNNQIYEEAGKIIIKSYLADISSFDIRTLTNLYPILCYDNWYYPHFKKIYIDSSERWTWAWTCAKDVTYKLESASVINLYIDFPIEYTHYLIIKGIPSFNSIYIYNMAFRTDPRFETYNSSGYVYKADTRTLLLKSRQKSGKETIRLTAAEKLGISDSSNTVVNFKTETPKATVPAEKKTVETSSAKSKEETKKEEPKKTETKKVESDKTKTESAKTEKPKTAETQKENAGKPKTTETPKKEETAKVSTDTAKKAEAPKTAEKKTDSAAVATETAKEQKKEPAAAPVATPTDSAE